MGDPADDRRRVTGEADARRLAHRAAAAVGAHQVAGVKTVRPLGGRTVSATLSSPARIAVSSWPHRMSTPRSRARFSRRRTSRGCCMSSACIGLSSMPRKFSDTPANIQPYAGFGGPSSPPNVWYRSRMSSCRITCPTRPLAFGSSLGPGSLSRTTGRTPASASSQASIRPLGPAPEMTTSAASRSFLPPGGPGGFG